MERDRQKERQVWNIPISDLTDSRLKPLQLFCKTSNMSYDWLIQTNPKHTRNPYLEELLEKLTSLCLSVINELTNNLITNNLMTNHSTLMNSLD